MRKELVIVLFLLALFDNSYEVTTENVLGTDNSINGEICICDTGNLVVYDSTGKVVFPEP